MMIDEQGLGRYVLHLTYFRRDRTIMFYLTKPDRSVIDAFLASAAKSGFSYSEIGYTAEANRSLEARSYNIDHNRVIIGKGDEDWERAKDAIRRWKMFDFPWVELCWPDVPIDEGRDVAILVSHFGFYSLNAARVVYTIDTANQFGFAYGTLADHGESGEERFSVERDDDTGEITYDLYAFSTPNHVMARLGYPVSRRLQKRFALNSKEAMTRAMHR